MTGSILTVVGMPAATNTSMAFSRLEDSGAPGSSFPESLSSVVRIVVETKHGTVCRMSMSLVTKSDFVTIWSLQKFFDSIFRQFLVKQVSCSSLGYGSDELDIEISSPFSFIASLVNLGSMFFLVLHSWKRGM